MALELGEEWQVALADLLYARLGVAEPGGERLQQADCQTARRAITAGDRLLDQPQAEHLFGFAGRLLPPATQPLHGKRPRQADGPGRQLLNVLCLLDRARVR